MLGIRKMIRSLQSNIIDSGIVWAAIWTLLVISIWSSRRMSKNDGNLNSDSEWNNNRTN